ncbi:MAG: hypothetical protein K1X86_05825 [Ignavibacteria bacterium]|nr:hypothetical protein [Ignavibacteria bacterium]
MRKIILLFSTAIFGFIIFTGQKSDDKPQKWAIDQKAMWLYDASNTYSAPLPMGKVDYVHPVTETRIINTQNGRYAVSPNL